MTKIAVIAHAGKTIGGGLEELRETLAGAGVGDPLWSEVPKSRFAPERVRRALDDGAELVFVWGGDGMVQRCVDVLAGSDVPFAIVPAGTANLFASSLEIPQDVEEAVNIGLNGSERTLDVGKLNGERFAVMAGAGLDAKMIQDADGGLKDRVGRLAYIWTASKHLRGDPFDARIEVNGELWYEDQASCVLLGNVGSLFAGVEVFDNAHPDDGMLELGVTNAEGIGEWARTFARTALGSATKSPFVQATKAKKVDVKLSRKVRYELDGGGRTTAKRLKIRVEPGAIRVRVPDGTNARAVASGSET
jgi:diacylglycerol kinase (ATP)